jgi:hypothetical protein
MPSPSKNSEEKTKMWELPAFQQPMTFGLYPNAYGAGSAIQQIVLQDRAKWEG